jgi:predicted negative regulator of RcsB-dependent stress response
VEELSEQEQWEQLKGWVRSNGPQVLMLVAIMLLGWYGWKWWQSHQQEQARAASDAYDVIMSRFDEQKMAEGVALIEALRTKYPKSPYVAAADMVAARIYVDTNQLDKAAQMLTSVMNTAPDEKLRPIARIRLARVQSALGEYDKALATLGDTPLGAQEAARLEARGDILYAKGDRAAALTEYLAARKIEPVTSDENAESTGSSTEVLDLKIADLQGPGSAAPAVPTAPQPGAKAPAAPAPAAAKP